MNQKNLHFLVVAAGKGIRFSIDIPKQFVLIENKPLAWYTLNNLHKTWPSAKITLVISPDHHAEWTSILAHLPFQISHIVNGGTERFDSVRNGLTTISSHDIVAIHDIARPIITPSFVQKGFQLALTHKLAIPILPIHDALIQKTSNSISYVNRNEFFRIQTPQFFDADLILSTFNSIKDETFPDEASAVLSCGHELHFFEGDPTNIKLTYPSDLALIEALLKTIN